MLRSLSVPKSYQLWISAVVAALCVALSGEAQQCPVTQPGEFAVSLIGQQGLFFSSGQNVTFRLRQATYHLQTCDIFSVDFGDGSAAVSRTAVDGAEIKHAYVTAAYMRVEAQASVTNSLGVYSRPVTVYITRDASSCPVWPPDFVLLGGDAMECVSPIASERPECVTGLQLTFSVNSTGIGGLQGCDVYEWDFGDGYSAIGRVVKHAYRRPGSYEVHARATNAYGTANGTRAISIHGQPLALRRRAVRH